MQFLHTYTYIPVILSAGASSLSRVPVTFAAHAALPLPQRPCVCTHLFQTTARPDALVCAPPRPARPTYPLPRATRTCTPPPPPIPLQAGTWRTTRATGLQPFIHGAWRGTRTRLRLAPSPTFTPALTTMPITACFTCRLPPRLHPPTPPAHLCPTTHFTPCPAWTPLLQLPTTWQAVTFVHLDMQLAFQHTAPHAAWHGNIANRRRAITQTVFERRVCLPRRYAPFFTRWCTLRWHSP